MGKNFHVRNLALEVLVLTPQPIKNRSKIIFLESVNGAM